MVTVRGKYVSSNNAPFGVAWRELKNQGWTSVRPKARNLECKWEYVRPDGNPNGIMGVNYFHGEDELLDYYTAASKGPSAAAARASPSLPAAVSVTPTAVAPTRSAAPRTSPPASSARIPQATVRKSPAKQRRKPQKAAATSKRWRSSRVKPPSDEEELSEAS
ncbi:hypothetical protein JG688_00016088, partial [Phytophthora aleatoria]